MRLHPDIIRRTEDGIRIDAPLGKVLLQPTPEGAPEGIATHYMAGPLVNGTAQNYAEAIRAEALEAARATPLPWRTRRDGSIRITDHAAFYEQSFSPQIEWLECLQRWLQTTQSDDF